MDLKPIIGPNLKISKPRMKRTRADRERQAERLDGSVRKGESVADYQARMLRQINSLDWNSKASDEPEL